MRMDHQSGRGPKAVWLTVIGLTYVRPAIGTGFAGTGQSFADSRAIQRLPHLWIARRAKRGDRRRRPQGASVCRTRL